MAPYSQPSGRQTERQQPGRGFKDVTRSAALPSSFRLMHSPQAALLLAPVALVVSPVPHSTQVGVGVVLLPPALHEPVAQVWQLRPPMPGRQTSGGAGYEREAWLLPRGWYQDVRWVNRQRAWGRLQMSRAASRQCWTGSAAPAPAQALDALALVLRVVKPAGQLWHGGVALDALPPADQVPAAQAPQFGPPRPGRQAAAECIGSGEWFGGRTGLKVPFLGCGSVFWLFLAVLGSNLAADVFRPGQGRFTGE